MFRFFRIPLLSLAILAASAAPVWAAERISQFTVQLNVHADATVDVVEHISYDFGGGMRHGIYRDIPVRYQARGGNFNIRLGNVYVTDEHGLPIPFTLSDEGSNRRIKIGDPNTLVSGVHTYAVAYTVSRVINYFSQDDEFYWNVTGNGWTVPIDQAAAAVTLPKPVSDPQLLRDCFVGIAGSTEHCGQHDIWTRPDADNNTSAVNFQTTSLAPGEGLTIVVGVPKGNIARPSLWQQLFFTIQDNWILGLPVVTLFIMLYLWWTRGRDPAGSGTIIAQYDVPDGLTPAEVGTIVDEKVDNYDISADIVYLAVQGYLKITRLDEKHFLGTSHDYELEQLKDEMGLSNDFEKTLLGSLFRGNPKTVKLSSLKETFYRDLQRVKEKVLESVVSKGYFPKKPQTVRLIYIGVAAAVAIVAVALWDKVWGAITALSLVLSAAIVALIGYFMPVRTRKGVLAKEHLLGLKLYLTVAEKDRLEFHNAPEKTPDHFEKLLPYAMALRVEKAWASQFAGIYNQPPSWYSGPGGVPFNSLILVHDLSGFSSAANASLSAQPASSGGSGFGGGGFSGGGFGGGGGGSW